MQKPRILIISLLLLALTWCINTYHLGVLKISIPNLENKSNQPAVFFDKNTYGLNHIFLYGNAYYRGQEFGKKTQILLHKHEDYLMSFYEQFLNNKFLKTASTLALMRWFWRNDQYLDQEQLLEIKGVSEFSQKKYDNIIDAFTRQYAFHGIHEVGQMFVDSTSQVRGCTQLGFKSNDSWIIGRNFDFEAGRDFDNDKILKWVFPDKGNPYVSIAWSGFTGVVTGVNDHGIYIALNAAGSNDHARYGNFSTLLIAKALQNASTLNEAVEIIKNGSLLITDIFVVADKKTVFTIEKSPSKFDIIEAKDYLVTTNHLQSSIWKNDATNNARIEKATTLSRFKRATELMINKHIEHNEKTILEFLRDKKGAGGKYIGVGNRNSIDALIATHSIIYNSKNQTLYVGEGPSLVGKFQGIDLKESFKQQRPVIRDTLPIDPEISLASYNQFQEMQQETQRLKVELINNNCNAAQGIYKKLSSNLIDNSFLYLVLGDFQFYCLKNIIEAKKLWSMSLSLSPSYKVEREYLLKRLTK